MKPKKTTPMHIAEELASRIAKGILSPNEHLVETVIAEEFKTSRAPVREALLMLEREKLVTRVPHHGFVVKKFTKEEIHQLYDATFRLEEIVMQKAIDKATEKDIALLDDILNKQKEAVEQQDVLGYYELNEQFHSVIFTIARNEFLRELHQSLRKSSRPLSILNMGQGTNLQASFEEHQKQVDALKKGDKQLAIAAIREQEARSLKTLDLIYYT